MAETKSLTGADGQFEAMALGPFRIMPGMTTAELKSDLDAVTRSLQRSAEPLVAKHVARLMVRTKMRVQGDAEGKLLAEVAVMDLCQYPPDVVAYACDYWVNGGRDNKFFPSWPELREICERRVQGRQRLKRALVWHLNHDEAPHA